MLKVILFSAISAYVSSAACSADKTAPVTNAPIQTPTPTTNPKRNPNPDRFAHLSPEHSEIVKVWLKTQPNYRPASEEADSGLLSDSDSSSLEGNVKFLRDTVGEKGNQYYAVGDMNQDGQTDFAVLLVNTKQLVSRDDIDEFALAIFNGPFRPDSRPAYFEKQLHGISNSYIVFDRMTKEHLFLGKFESDVYCATYYKNGKTYRFKDCL